MREKQYRRNIKGVSPQENKGVRLAIMRMGGQERLAKILGVQQPTISYWLHTELPVMRAIEIERKTGVSRKLLRPDVFGNEAIPQKQ